MEADVAVIGLGAMGAMAMWRLAERGASVVGFDQFDPPHARGSSHGESRIFRLSAYDGPFYVPLATAANRLWDELGSEAGMPLLVRTGLLEIDRVGDSLGEIARAGLRKHRVPFEEFPSSEARSRFAARHFAADERCLVDPAGGFVRPELAISSALALAEARGATIRRNTRVDAVSGNTKHAEIRAGNDVYTVRHVINATGGWIGDLLPGLRPHVQVERRVQVWLEIVEPELFTPDNFPVFIHRLAENRSTYGFPSLDGRTVKIGAHHEGAVSAHPDDIDRRVTPADADAVVNYAINHLLGVTSHVVRTALCFYPSATDGHFVVGQLPGQPWQTIIGATSGHGFKFATALGDIAADLGLRGETDLPIDRFRPDRLLA
ncbi:MAG: N-methyl-L-tryptophan oxidase [Candidatus Dormibacteria bacterium]